MPRGIPALVRPALLVWARERAGFSLEQAAEKTGNEIETLRSWEASGGEHPSIPQLRKLGEVYKRPLAVFFLPKPPEGFDPQSEFRRLAGLTPQNETPELRLALRMALFRREAAREMYAQLGDSVQTCTTVVHPHEQDETVGQRIRDLLGISWRDQLGWAGPYAALNAWRAAVERQGILVFQTGDVELSEMRGTSIPHGPLPVILLNNADAPHGRIFTLLHEFAHILMANGGHQTSSMDGKRMPEEQFLERASNRFAAAALLPAKEFLAEAHNFPGALVGDDDDLRRFANRIKVSPEAILRRLLSLQKIPASVYRVKRKGWQQKPWHSPPQAAGGPPIEVRVISSVGRPFASLVLESYQRNAVSSSDVVDFLGVQLKHLTKIAGQLIPEPGGAFG